MLNLLKTIIKKKLNIISLQKNSPLPKELKLAKQYLTKGAFEEAESLCQKYLKLNADDEMGLRMLISVLFNQRKYEECLTVTTSVKDKCGNDLWLVNKRVEAYSALSLTDKTLEELEIAAELSGRDIKSLFRLAQELSRAALRDEEAIPIYEEILRSEKAKTFHYLDYARCLNSIGETEKSIEVLKKSLELGDLQGRIYWELSDLKSYKFSEDDIKAMVELDESNTLTPEDSKSLFYALGKAYEDTKVFDQSFNYYKRANKIHSLRLRYDSDQAENKYNWLLKLCTKDFFHNKKEIGINNCTPIFIVGMHRSGSTLIEQILSSHSSVDGTKELPFIMDIVNTITSKEENYKSNASAYPTALLNCIDEEFVTMGQEYLTKVAELRAEGTHFIDKMPGNYFHIGLILTLFPNAKIIDARRHPLSVGISIFRQQLGAGHANELYDIGHYYKYYVKLMRFWHNVFPGKIHRVQYEDMVNNTETEISSLLEFCGLPFESNCLNFHSTERAVKTPSANQVRQPIYKSSVEQWKNYDEYLSPLKDGLGEVLKSYNSDVVKLQQRL